MGRFSEIGDSRKQRIETDCELAKEFGWSFNDIKQLTCFEKQTVIRKLNRDRRKAHRQTKKKW